MRVARHVTMVATLLNVFTELNPDKPATVSNIPAYEEMAESNIGDYLNPAP